MYAMTRIRHRMALGWFCVLACTFSIITLRGVSAANEIVVNYRVLINVTAIGHSGLYAGDVLSALEAGPVDIPTESLLADIEPLVEPLSYALEDVLLTREPERLNRPVIDIGTLFPPGGQEPAWADLVRSRHFHVLSDGVSYVRMYLPGGQAEAAYKQHSSVIRHVLNWLLFQSPQQHLDVEVFAFTHDPARSEFTLNLVNHKFVVDGLIPPNGAAVNVSALREFFERKSLTLEGAAIREGQLVLIGSERDPIPTLDGSPVSVADLVVAYRAARFPGKSGVYMSLDRGQVPEQVNVNFGGRLHDTRIGRVTLRCDERFKTFAASVDPDSPELLAEIIRQKQPGFLTQNERMFRTPGAQAVQTEETRFWTTPMV